jgi:hypothetical protein
MLGAGAVRARLLDIPLERDEGGFAYFGERMLEGVAPFASGYTMHLPGTAAVYAASMAVFGRSAQGARLGLLVTNVLTILFVFLLAQMATLEVGALAAAGAYAVLSLSPEVLGPFGHANHYVTLFGTAGLWTLTRAQVSGRVAWFVLAGLILGVSPVMKQSGLIFPAFALFWLIWCHSRRSARDWRTLGLQAGVFLAGAVVPMVLTFCVLAASGVLPKAWYWVYTYASAYSGMETPAAGLRNLGNRLARLLPASAGLVSLALGGLIARDPAGVEARPLMGWAFPGALLATTLLAASPGLYFRQHYFIPVLLPLSLLCGRAVSAIAGAGPKLRSVAAAAVIALACAQSVAAQAEVLFRMNPEQIARKIYGANPFPESVEVARYLEAHTTPHDRIAVLGSEPQMLFYAHRLSATGYLYLYPLVEPNPLGPEMRQELIQEVTEANPKYIVWIDVPASWTFRVAAATPIVQWARQLIESRYTLDGRVAIRSATQTDYAWGEDAARLGVRGANVLLFRRVNP